MLSSYDVEHIHDIMAGKGDWFGAQLMRLYRKANLENRELLRRVYPAHTELVEWWYDHRADEPHPMELVGKN